MISWKVCKDESVSKIVGIKVFEKVSNRQIRTKRLNWIEGQTWNAMKDSNKTYNFDEVLATILVSRRFASFRK